VEAQAITRLPSVATNTLRCPNPFQIAEPPDWWLREMDLFDPKLVVFPSQKRMTFILARRCTRTKGESPHDVKGLSQNPDTILMASNRLIKVCEILPGVIWDQRIFQKLAAHDIERQGGASEVANKLDAMDLKKRETDQRVQEAEVAARASDAYKAYAYKTGARISLNPANKHGRGDTTPNKVSVHVQKPTPSARQVTLT
jgi:hypothetical protein